jgi:hypothetical protein
MRPTKHRIKEDRTVLAQECKKVDGVNVKILGRILRPTYITLKDIAYPSTRTRGQFSTGVLKGASVSIDGVITFRMGW